MPTLQEQIDQAQQQKLEFPEEAEKLDELIRILKEEQANQPN